MKTKKCYSNRHKLKKRAIEYLGSQCAVCGQKVDFWHPENSFECHHFTGKKLFTIGTDAHKYSWQEVKSELNKCILTCSSCHRFIHNILQGTGIKPYE